MPVARTRTAARPPLTGRALVLGGVVIFLVVLLASPVHRYLSTRAAVRDANEQLIVSQAELAKLQGELKKWEDIAFVTQQARNRLQYAMPGETSYVVVRPGDKPGHEQAQEQTGVTKVPGGNWRERMWGSVRTADE